MNIGELREWENEKEREDRYAEKPYYSLGVKVYTRTDGMALYTRLYVDELRKAVYHRVEPDDPKTLGQELKEMFQAWFWFNSLLLLASFPFMIAYAIAHYVIGELS